MEYYIEHTDSGSRVMREGEFLVHTFGKLENSRDAKKTAENYAQFCNKQHEAYGDAKP